MPDTNLDPNSPELFKENIKVAQAHLRHVQSLARDALDGIERAYQAHTNPTQTVASLATLKQSLHDLSELLRITGVGALPLLASDVTEPPQENQLADQTTKAIKTLFNRNSQNQESSAVAANLLTASDVPSHR
ncbi:hypothetical protein EW146_g3553 [Bondarzewia mesenterica]|uniref:Uncharacterized protein n=1 Tax=Bondarzewia mesenterica TaxID=1095465 RepID=A0A4S4LZ25_9AGAM|nr:hypothetical protein EW146_g3553 [Bondarzewia mesenterica]